MQRNEFFKKALKKKRENSYRAILDLKRKEKLNANSFRFCKYFFCNRPVVKKKDIQKEEEKERKKKKEGRKGKQEEEDEKVNRGECVREKEGGQKKFSGKTFCTNDSFVVRTLCVLCVKNFHANALHGWSRTSHKRKNVHAGFDDKRGKLYRRSFTYLSNYVTSRHVRTENVFFFCNPTTVIQA